MAQYTPEYQPTGDEVAVITTSKGRQEKRSGLPSRRKPLMLEAAISKLTIHGKTVWRICARGLEKRRLLPKS